MAASAELELTLARLEEQEGQLAGSQASVAVVHQELQHCSAQIHQPEIQMHQGQIQQQEQDLVSEDAATSGLRAELATRRDEVSELETQLTAAGRELAAKQAALEGAEATLATESASEVSGRLQAEGQVRNARGEGRCTLCGDRGFWRTLSISPPFSLDPHFSGPVAPIPSG